MKMQFRRINAAIIVAIYALLLLACNMPSPKTSGVDSAEPGTTKVIVYHADSGVSFKSKVFLLRNIAKYLGLPALTGGYPGLYIRVWAWDSTGTKWVIDLRKNPQGNSCTVLSYTGRRKDSAVGYIYIHEQRNVIPQSGWASFFDSLGKFHIPEMEKEKVPKDRKRDFTSLAYVQFEVDQPNQYRYLEYPEPSYFQKEDTACKLIYEFLKYFNKEMGTNIYTGKIAEEQ